MNARIPNDKLHRLPDEYPALAPGGPSVQLPAWNLSWNRVQIGRTATGGCTYGGQVATIWAPQADLLNVTNGPIGCGLYAQANRPQGRRLAGVNAFGGINLCTDFQEKDIVFGGEKKLAKAIDEANALFPLNQGATLLSTCPIALIGDDIDAVARRKSAEIGKPVVPVHCAGYRRGEGIGSMDRTIFSTWRDWAAEAREPGERDVVLLCREMGGAWRDIQTLLEQLGLRVLAHWPGGSDRDNVAQLGVGRLVISIDMEYWAKRAESLFGTPWVDVDFLGPTATADSLREIARHFGDDVKSRAESLIAAGQAQVADTLAAARGRIEGLLHFSFGPMLPNSLRAYQDFGLRVGTALQGWPDQRGQWCVPPNIRRYQEMTPDEAYSLLRQVQPDVVDSPGQDGHGLRKMGYTIMDEHAQREFERAAIGFVGVPRLAREMLRLFDGPMRRVRSGLPPFTRTKARAGWCDLRHRITPRR